MSQLAVQVALPMPVDTLYSYTVPEEYAAAIAPGSRVLVPFGRRQLIGYAVEVGPAPATGRKLKAISDLVDEKPLLTPDLLEFARRLAEYYLCGWGEALKAALPPGINGTARCYYEEQPDESLREAIRLTPRRQAILRLVRERGAVSKAWLAQELDAALSHDLNELLRAGFLVRRDVVEATQRQTRGRRVIELAVPAGSADLRRLLDEKERRAPRQAELLRLLLTRAEGRLDREDAKSQGFSDSVIRELLKTPFVAEGRVEELPADEYDTDASVLDIVLNTAQSAVVETVAAKIGRRPKRGREDRYGTFLLHGVTGSGKTQVYLELARRARAENRGVLILVPEIALTPQIVARFRSYLGPQVAVVHSRLSGTQRFAIWESLRSGRCRVIVGARSALFAPVPDLGLIVVDEEHESSFKQYEPAPRYHARDAAVLRAHQLGIPVLLGSATPSMESWQNARDGRYTLLELPERVGGRPLPAVELVDMKANLEEIGGRGRTVRAFGDKLIAALLETLDKGRKVILLQNRRGHSPWLQCPDCGEALKCVRCDVSMVWHRLTGNCHCHLCGLSRPAPERCPECGGGPLAYLGTGTQKVEEELLEIRPDVKLLRMDRDTTSARGAYVRMVREFNTGDYEVLLGTQSVAKGLDFSQVTLVGVIQADTELNLQDFRAQEWSFQLISQVAGRAGRGEEPGRVVVQTFRTDNPALKRAAAHDYRGFAEEELAERRALAYPPFARMVRLVVKSVDEEHAAAACRSLADEFHRDPGPVTALGPGPAPVRMVRREYRYHLLLRSRRENDPGGKALRAAASRLKTHFERKLKARDLSLILDVDPQGVM